MLARARKAYSCVQRAAAFFKGCKEDYPEEGVVTDAIVSQDAPVPRVNHLLHPPLQLSPLPSFHKLFPLWRMFSYTPQSQFLPYPLSNK